MKNLLLLLLVFALASCGNGTNNEQSETLDTTVAVEPTVPAPVPTRADSANMVNGTIPVYKEVSPPDSATLAANSANASRIWCCNSKGHDDSEWDECKDQITFDTYKECYEHNKKHQQSYPGHDSGCR